MKDAPAKPTPMCSCGHSLAAHWRLLGLPLICSRSGCACRGYRVAQ